MPEKIRALARVLADGLQDDGDVDEATVLALALADLEGSHVRVLQCMEEPRRGATNGNPWVLTASPLPFDEIQVGHRTCQILDAVFAVLRRHGLVTDRPRSRQDEGLRAGAAPWWVTDVGYLCLQLLGHDPRSEATN